MKPFLHARNSARQFGGVPADYIDIHNFIDGSKAAVPDVRHRALLHNAFGCFVVEAVFGVTRRNSAGVEYSPRDVAEAHIIEDLGFIPTVEHYLKNMQLVDWMGGGRRLQMMRRAKGNPPRPIDPCETLVRQELAAEGLAYMGKAPVTSQPRKPPPPMPLAESEEDTSCGVGAQVDEYENVD